MLEDSINISTGKPFSVLAEEITDNSTYKSLVSIFVNMRASSQ